MFVSCMRENHSISQWDNANANLPRATGRMTSRLDAHTTINIAAFPPRGLVATSRHLLAGGPLHSTSVGARNYQAGIDTRCKNANTRHQHAYTTTCTHNIRCQRQHNKHNLVRREHKHAKKRNVRLHPSCGCHPDFDSFTAAAIPSKHGVVTKFETHTKTTRTNMRAVTIA